MKKTKSILFVILCCMVLTCTSGNVKSDPFEWTASEEKRRKEYWAEAKKVFPNLIEYNQITPEFFEKNGDYVFTIRASNFIGKWYKTGQLVKLPVFRGTMGDVLYDDFVKYCRVKKLMEKGIGVSFFWINFQEGECNKVLEEFKEFYASRLPINFKEKPTEISYAYFYHTYAFTSDGVDMELTIFFPAGSDGEKCRNEWTKLGYIINFK